MAIGNELLAVRKGKFGTIVQLELSEEDYPLLMTWHKADMAQGLT
jgi:hypothetical protein